MYIHFPPSVNKELNCIDVELRFCLNDNSRANSQKKLRLT